MRHRKLTTAAQAFEQIKTQKIAALRKKPVSQYFTWGEVFANRTDAQITSDATIAELEACYTLAQQLDIVRGFLGGHPVTVTSWWRDAATQTRLVGGGLGAQNSWHPKGYAVDIKVAGLSPKTVFDRLKSWWPGEVGDGSRHGFTHLASSLANKTFLY